MIDHQSAVSETSSPQPRCQRPVHPLISSSDFFKVSVRPKRTSPPSSLAPQYHKSTVRPKTAPPAPPVKELMAAAATPLASIPAKKPLSRLPTAFSESQIATERSWLMGEYSLTKVHSLGELRSAC